MKTFRVYLVEDHDLLRRSLRMLMEKGMGLHVCGDCGSAEEALEGIRAAAPDLVLIDMSLPGMSGLSLLDELREREPDLPCIMLSGHRDPAYVDRAMAAGARGYIVKGDSTELPRAIEDVVRGKPYISTSEG